jgi:DNA-binding MarR family transcriptional regulator
MAIQTASGVPDRRIAFSRNAGPHPNSTEPLVAISNQNLVRAVSKHHYPPVIEEPEMDGRVIAELLLHLGRIASGDGLVEGLTPVQWTGLRYFARANRFSRTPSAFAAFQGTTRGTASQTIKSLETQAYLTRMRSPADGRSTRLDLTGKARAILAYDPFEALVRAADALPSAVCGHFANGLQRMLGQVARERGKPPFGTCASCEHLEGGDCCQEGQTHYSCGFASEKLRLAELDELCIYFVPGKPAATKHPVIGAASR